MTTHPSCGATWISKVAEHCPCCHETFTGTQSGDRHRIGGWGEDLGPSGPRRCRTREEMIAIGLVQDPRGFWGTSPNLRGGTENLARRLPPRA